MATNKISVRAGGTLTLACTKKDAAGTEESVATTTVTATLTELGSNTHKADFTVVKTGGGKFTLSLTPAQTTSIGPGAYLVNLKYLYPSTVVDLVDAFSLEIKP